MDTFTQNSLKILQLLQKAAKDDTSEVASIAVCDGHSILMGKRRDSGRYTIPGGHLDKGEEKVDGAVRELFEESGIKVDPKDLEYLGSEKVTTHSGKSKIIHAYIYQHDGERPTTKHDPDKEVEKWEWIDCKDGIPKDVAENSHTPIDKNIVFKFMDLSPEELDKGELKKFWWGSLAGTPKRKKNVLYGDSPLDPELDKSNYGPKKLGLYDPKVNAERKQGRTGTEAEGAGPNKEIKEIAPGGRQSGKDQAASIATEAKRKSRNMPVKIYSKEDIAKLIPQITNKKVHKSEMKHNLEGQGFFQPDWRQSYLQHGQPQKQQPQADSKDMMEGLKEMLLKLGKMVYHPKRGYIWNRKIEDHGDGTPLMRTEEPPMKLVHYSPIQGLKVLNPEFQGTGFRDESMKRRGKPIHPVTYYYTPGSENQDDPGVVSNAKSKYTVMLQPGYKLYDLAHDKDKIVQNTVQANQGAWDRDAIEGAIKTAGYHGYHNSMGRLPGAVALFHPHPIKSEEVLNG